VRQKRAKLVGHHSASCDCLKARWPLRNGTGRIAADDMTIGTPLPRELRAFLNVRPDGMRDQGKHR